MNLRSLARKVERIEEAAACIQPPPPTEEELSAKAEELLQRVMKARTLTREDAIELMRERAPTLATYLRGEGYENRRPVEENQAD